MQVSFGQLPFEVIHELRKRKWTAFFVFFLVSLSILTVGLFWPKKYTASTTIFVDDQNIIRPLMEGSAVTTKIPDRASAASEVIFSRRVLEQLVKLEDLWGKRAKTEEGQEALIAMLRSSVVIAPRGKNFFSIAFTDSDPTRTFRVANKIAQVFISESEISKKEESRNAYEFVDKQVKAYQSQLQESEERLKNFLAGNVDGSENTAFTRISELERKIEQAQLETKEAQAQRASLQSQLSGESRMVRQDLVGESYRSRIDELQKKLDALRLTYHDTYPDIVSLKQQIDELKRSMAIELAKPESDQSADGSLNPIYQELRAQIALTETKISTLQTREASLQALLDDEHERMGRIQDKKARLSELTRDMEVNKEIYNDLLKRRERARVSMRLDVEGQGLSYKIQEPANYPLTPVGIRFEHFALAGLFVGLLAPIGLIVGVLQIDPRVRVASVFEENIGIPVLTTIPHVETPVERRGQRRRTLIIIICALLTAVLYVWVSWLKYQGVLL